MIAALVVSFFAVAAFGLGLWRSDLLPVARDAISTALSGISAMTDSALGDDAKEAAVKKAAFALIRAAGVIALRFAVILALAFIPIGFAHLLGLTTISDVSALMMRWDYILVVSVLAIAVGEGIRRRAQHNRPASAEGGPSSTSVSAYSDIDRFLHGIAFSSPALHRRVSGLEDRIIGKPRVTQGAPIFVTSLARGGTTALLNAMGQFPGIATHTYRDMPFLTAPVLWNRLAGGSRRRVAARDRAHGDGLTISLDSPEAFEEVIWKMHWPEKYGDDGISLWTEADRKAKADQFMSEHMAKIIRARFGQSPTPPVRYCSKNNANIARLAYLPAAFPNCEIVVPLRHPARHAASLHRQHLNFLALQDEDQFVRKYMGDIGHFEFGRIYTPLRFPGFDAARIDPERPDHWLDYWIHAFRSVEDRLSAGQHLILVRQDSLRERPQDTMEALADHLRLSTSDLSFDAVFRSGPDTGDDSAFDPTLLREAEAIYGRLSRHAL